MEVGRGVTGQGGGRMGPGRLQERVDPVSISCAILYPLSFSLLVLFLSLDSH